MLKRVAVADGNVLTLDSSVQSEILFERVKVADSRDRRLGDTHPLTIPIDDTLIQITDDKRDLRSRIHLVVRGCRRIAGRLSNRSIYAVAESIISLAGLDGRIC